MKIPDFTHDIASNIQKQVYLGPPYCRAELCAGRVACCPLVSHGEYVERKDRHTDGRIPDRYITLSARRGQSKTDTIKNQYYL